MGNVKFEDYSIKVKAALNDEVIAWLYEVGGEVAAHAGRNCELKKDDVGVDLKGSYDYRVNETAGETIVGTPYEAGYWEEFGTGSYAAHGDGRKGWWVYCKGQKRKDGGKVYRTQKEAEEAAEYLRKEKGLEAYATNGRKPNRTLQRAFAATKNKSIKSLEDKLKNRMG